MFEKVREWLEYKRSERQANAEVESRILKVKVEMLDFFGMTEKEMKERCK